MKKKLTNLLISVLVFTFCGCADSPKEYALQESQQFNPTYNSKCVVLGNKLYLCDVNANGIHHEYLCLLCGYGCSITHFEGCKYCNPK